MNKRHWGEHGTVRRYRQGGCDDLIGGVAGEGLRCQPCAQAGKEARQRAKAGLTQRNTNKNVTVLDKRRLRSVGNESKSEGAQSNTAPNPSKPPSKPAGPVELAIIEQTREYVDSNPADVAIALVAARILDDPESRGMVPQTMRQLDAILVRLCGKKKTKSNGRLAAVSAMARAR